jgi:hypothetical protein
MAQLLSADANPVQECFQVAHLCDWCSNILINQRARRKGSGTHSGQFFLVDGSRKFQQLEVASKTSCPICLTVYLAAQRYDFMDKEELRCNLHLNYKTSKHDLPQILVWDANTQRPLRWIFELLPMSDKAAESCPRIGPYGYLSNSADLMVASLVISWLSNCSAQHKLCRHRSSSSYRPPRLIEIADNRIKLVDTNKLQSGISYATLSHCWGDSPIFLNLTDQNTRRP